jgi:putative ABC transport system permease protein
MQMLWENLRIALSALGSKKGRSALTIMGVLIGVFAITELLAVGQGVRSEVTKQIEVLGTRVVILFPGKVSPQGGFNPASSLGVSTLKESDLDVIARLPAVEAVAPIMIVSGQIASGATVDSAALIYGTTDQIQSVYPRALELGRHFTSAEVDGKADVAVLGASNRKILFGSTDPVGQTVRTQNHDFTVIGVLKETNSALQVGGANADGVLYIPFTTAQVVTKQTNILRILAKFREGTNVPAAVEALTAAVRANHNGTDDFSVLTQKDLLKLIDSVLNLLTLLVSAIASISLLVGGIGIMNIMLVSVTERTREIGLRKAVGAADRDILVQFLAEAVLLSAVGSGAGLGLAAVASRVVSASGGFTPVVGLDLVGLAVGFALAVGVVFGLAPAIRAARLNPIDALRYE